MAFVNRDYYTYHNYDQGNASGKAVKPFYYRRTGYKGPGPCVHSYSRKWRLLRACHTTVSYVSGPLLCSIWDAVLIRQRQKHDSCKVCLASYYRHPIWKTLETGQSARVQLKSELRKAVIVGPAGIREEAQKIAIPTIWG